MWASYFFFFLKINTDRLSCMPVEKALYNRHSDFTALIQAGFPESVMT